MRSRRCQGLLGLLVLALFLAPAVSAQTTEELAKEIQALKEGQEAIQKQLEEIKKLVQQRPAAPRAPQGPNVAGKVFDLGPNPVLGDKTAAVTLVEFTDYQ